MSACTTRKINWLRHSALIYPHCTTHTCYDCNMRMQVPTCIVIDIQAGKVFRFRKSNETYSICVSISAKGRIHWKTGPRTCEDLCAVSCVAFSPQAILIMIHLSNTEPQAPNRLLALRDRIHSAQSLGLKRKASDALDEASNKPKQPISWVLGPLYKYDGSATCKVWNLELATG